MKPVSKRAENIVGQGENAGFQHFLLFLQYFQMASSDCCLNLGLLRLFPYTKNVDLFELKAYVDDSSNLWMSEIHVLS